MNLIPIFESDLLPRRECYLWAVQYPGEEQNEFDRLFDLWADPLKLRTFFKNNQEYLNGEFWQKMTINEAIIKARDEAYLLENILIEIEDSARENNFEKFRSTFHSLKYSSKSPFEVKAKTQSGLPFLRLYGLILEGNKILITGGGIKLTRTMQESPYLANELIKLEKVKNFLNANAIIYLEDYDEE